VFATLNPAADARSAGRAGLVAVVFLDPDQLTALVNSFKGSTIYEIVAMAAFTGMRPISTWRSRN
jgi:hypothetical protein